MYLVSGGRNIGHQVYALSFSATSLRLLPRIVSEETLVYVFTFVPLYEISFFWTAFNIFFFHWLSAV